MKARKRIQHEITLIAWSRDLSGCESIIEIVETSRHFASHFTRRWIKDAAITRIEARSATYRLGDSRQRVQ